MPNNSLLKTSWDTVYAQGKYDQERPLPFVNDIVTTLNAYHMTDGEGYYPGCGNGRNFIALTRAGLTLEGCDISEEAINQLTTKLPAAKERVYVGDFLEDTSSKQYDYLVSIQMFQHGGDDKVTQYFQRAKDMLKPHGILFLRVNSIHTELYRQHKLVNRNDFGGKSVYYDEGSKAGQTIHFYSAEELSHILGNDFSILMPLREVFITRQDGSGSRWAQWETIVQKRG